MRGSPWSPLCCEYLFFCAKQRDGTSPYRGTTISAVRAALEHDGQPVETAWPYLSGLPADLRQWLPPSPIGLLYRRSSQPNGGAFDDVWSAVEAGRPPVVGMTLSPAFTLPAGDGVVDADEPDPPTGQHAVVAIATGERAGQRLLLVRNSWGEGWGLSGHAWLSERYAARHIRIAFTLN